MRLKRQADKWSKIEYKKNMKRKTWIFWRKMFSGFKGWNQEKEWNGGGNRNRSKSFVLKTDYQLPNSPPPLSLFFSNNGFRSHTWVTLGEMSSSLWNDLWWEPSLHKHFLKMRVPTLASSLPWKPSLPFFILHRFAFFISFVVYPSSEKIKLRICLFSEFL